MTAQRTVPAPPTWMLVSLTFSGTLAMHLFVPALPDVAREFGASQASVQLTISLYVLGMALGQLIYGPFADCHGRRPALMVGLAVYTLAGAVAAASMTVGTMLGARLLQAMGGCAGMLLSRAIIRDTCSTEDGVRRLALVSMMALVGPGLAPLLGAALVGAWGWRSLFYGLTLLGLFNLLLTWRCIPETGKPTGLLSVAGVRRDYAALLRNPRFVGFAVAGALSTTSFYGYIAAAPFIFVHQLGRTLHEVGIFLALMMLGVALGNAMAGRLAQRISIDKTMVAANALSGLCAVVLFVLAWWQRLDTTLLGGLMFLYGAGVGSCGPAVLIKVLSVDRRFIGSAAGLFGVAQMSAGALCTVLSGLGTDPALSAFGVLLGAGIVAQLSFGVSIWIERVRSEASPGEGTDRRGSAHQQ